VLGIPLFRAADCSAARSTPTGHVVELLVRSKRHGDESRGQGIRPPLPRSTLSTTCLLAVSVPIIRITKQVALVITWKAAITIDGRVGTMVGPRVLPGDTEGKQAGVLTSRRHHLLPPARIA
jgi:hypothetical protein